MTNPSPPPRARITGTTTQSITACSGRQERVPPLQPAIRKLLAISCASCERRLQRAALQHGTYLRLSLKYLARA